MFHLLPDSRRLIFGIKLCASLRTMPPQIKQDLNRSGWESTDFPSVCESCLPENPYVQMLKEEYAAECKICTRPYTVFRWKADRTSRQKKTNLCLTCARLKNCCQCCMLDLSFGLPIQIRDAALKLVAPGPESSINREYYAQNHERAIEEGRGGTEEYEKTDEKARELLRRLATSGPYARQRRIREDEDPADPSGSTEIRHVGGPGPIRSSDFSHRGASGRGAFRGGRGAARGRGGHIGGSAPPGPEDILPPNDPTIISLFVTGIEEDLPEYAVRDFFAPFGKIKSLVCSHRSHCAFVNYAAREAAEAAAASCQGRIVINGCPLRVRWGKPRPVGTMDADERSKLGREGRAAVRAVPVAAASASPQIEAPVAAPSEPEVLPPPGAEDYRYASQIGEG